MPCFLSMSAFSLLLENFLPSKHLFLCNTRLCSLTLVIPLKLYHTSCQAGDGQVHPPCLPYRHPCLVGVAWCTRRAVLLAQAGSNKVGGMPRYDWRKISLCQTWVPPIVWKDKIYDWTSIADFFTFAILTGIMVQLSEVVRTMIWKGSCWKLGR